MNTFNALAGYASRDRSPSAFKAFAEEVMVLAQALLSPGKIIAEVEQMRALQVEASRIENTEPARAADLRRQASLIGLR